MLFAVMVTMISSQIVQNGDGCNEDGRSCDGDDESIETMRMIPMEMMTMRLSVNPIPGPRFQSDFQYLSS